MAGEVVDQFCSQRSIATRERMFGTASCLIEFWLLLEYSGRWTHDLLADSKLPSEVKGLLRHALDRLPHSRLFFVKNDLRAQAGLSFFLAITRPRQQALYRFELDDYHDLLSVDVVGLARGEVADPLHLVDTPLYLVCADGKHDKCCAKYGLPVYRELARWSGEAAWQSSHLGGDRFAASVVWLPGGVYYGHVAPDDVRRIVEDAEADRVYLDKLRGRSCYTFDVQAADYFARVASGLEQLEALAVEQVSRSDGLTYVRLREAPADRVHVVEVARDSSSLRGLLTCSSTWEQDIPQYLLHSYRVEDAASG